jgi:dTDP-4-amino-4,6-dideoxy-D-galactose acyltransferase
VTADSCCEFLEWDSDHFHIPVARVRGNRLAPGDVERVEEWCMQRGIRCLYFLCDSDCESSAAAAESRGFRLVDVRVTLQLDGRPPAPRRGLAAGIAIRAARPDDLPALITIARRAHTDSRFFADPQFSREQCEGLYETWIRRSTNGWASAVWVADTGGPAVGYITCHGGTSAPGSIGLIGVASQCQGRGIGPALVARAVAWFLESGARPVTVVTQGRNIRAQRLYQRAGFITSAVQLWFHRWY